MPILDEIKEKHIVIHFIKEPKDLGLQSPFIFKDQWFKAREIDSLGVWIEMPEMMGTLLIQNTDGTTETKEQKMPQSARLVPWKYIESLTVPDKDVPKQKEPMGFFPK